MYIDTLFASAKGAVPVPGVVVCLLLWWLIFINENKKEKEKGT